MNHKPAIHVKIKLRFSKWKESFVICVSLGSDNVSEFTGRVIKTNVKTWYSKCTLCVCLYDFAHMLCLQDSGFTEPARREEKTKI